MVRYNPYLIALIIILAGINVVLFVNGINLDCGGCSIAFSNYRVSGAVVELPPIEVKAQELYDNFVEDNCLIKWDRVRGYYLK